MKDTTNFYIEFENKFRGSRDLILGRLKVYQDIYTAFAGQKPGPIAIDLGCGRGEWLQLLQESGIKAIGVDHNPGMSSYSSELGLEVHAGDVLDYLRTCPTGYAAIISAFHVIEHLSFAMLLDLTHEIFRVLQPGGILIFETPNPENLQVGTSTFYLDPTHRAPLPCELVEHICKSAGFARSVIWRLNEPESKSNTQDRILSVITGVSPDYAVIAQKEGTGERISRLDSVFERTMGSSLIEVATQFDNESARQTSIAEAMRAQYDRDVTAFTASCNEAIAQSRRDADQWRDAVKAADERAEGWRDAMKAAEERAEGWRDAVKAADERADHWRDAVKAADERADHWRDAVKAADERADHWRDAVKAADERADHWRDALKAAEERAEGWRGSTEAADERANRQHAELLAAQESLRAKDLRFVELEREARSSSENLSLASWESAQLRATNAENEAAITAMRNSTSWRLTAPIRAVSRFGASFAKGPKALGRALAEKLLTFVRANPYLKRPIMVVASLVPPLQRKLVDFGKIRTTAPESFASPPVSPSVNETEYFGGASEKSVAMGARRRLAPRAEAIFDAVIDEQARAIREGA